VKRTIFFIFICLIRQLSFAQEKQLHGRVYLSPALAFSPIENRKINDNITTSTYSTTTRLVLGVGVDLLQEFNKNWSIGLTACFIQKGYLAIEETVYSNGVNMGGGYERKDLLYLQPMLFIEKNLPIKHSKYMFLLSSGLFYSFVPYKLSPLGTPSPEERLGNDFGVSVATGICRKHLFTKIDFQKGLIGIKNFSNNHFTTSIINFNIGCVF
jgi:hypothetical protein